MKADLQNRADIVRLINTFYDKLLKDELVAHLFIEVAKIDLDEHLPILYDFWENILFQTGTYRRDAMTPHLDLHRMHPLKEEHFDRWLKLFDESMDELFEGEKARQAKVRALSIATVIRIKIHQMTTT